MQVDIKKELKKLYFDFKLDKDCGSTKPKLELKMMTLEQPILNFILNIGGGLTRQKVLRNIVFKHLAGDLVNISTQIEG